MEIFVSNWQEFQLLLDAAKRNKLRIIWVYVSACLYDLTALKDYQPAHDINKPLNSLSEAEQDQVLREICEQIASAANNTSIGIVEKDTNIATVNNHASIGIVNKCTNEEISNHTPIGIVDFLIPSFPSMAKLRM